MTKIGKTQKIGVLVKLVSVRIIPVALLPVFFPVLRDAAFAEILCLAVSWMAAEVFTENTGTNAQSRNTETDRYSRHGVLLAHLAAFWLPSLEMIIRGDRGSLQLQVAGGLMFVFGATLRIMAIRTLGRFFTGYVQIFDGQKVCKEGVYGLVRHPSYVGLFFINITPSLIMFAPSSFVVIVVFTLIANKYRVAVEEKTLIAAFRQDYRDYMAETPRWIPAIFTSKKHEAGA